FRSDQDDRLALPDLERDAVQHDPVAERLAHTLEHDAHRSVAAQNASRTRISMLPTTTARVVARPTAAAPPDTVYPKKHPIAVTTSPNEVALIHEYRTSKGSKKRRTPRMNSGVERSSR